MVVYSGFEAEALDSLSVIRLGEHLERLTARDLRALETSVPFETLKAVVDVAIEIGREGREGKAVGTLIVVGDARNVMTRTRQLGFDPFKGYRRKERNVRDFRVREAIKEIAQLDGAFVVARDGTVEAACRLIDAPMTGLTLPKGLGTRHWAAAAITEVTKAVAVVVSQSNGTVRLFQNGEVILRIAPDAPRPRHEMARRRHRARRHRDALRRTAAKLETPPSLVSIAEGPRNPWPGHFHANLLPTCSTVRRCSDRARMPTQCGRSVPDERGLVLVADGVGGLDLCGIALRYVLAARTAAVRDPDLSVGSRLGPLARRSHRRRQSRCQGPVDRRDDSPATRRASRAIPSSWSPNRAARASSVKALELLDEQTVERVVLLAPALRPPTTSPPPSAPSAGRSSSSGHLSTCSSWERALACSARSIASRPSSAGLVGFRVPASTARPDAEASEYGKLRQVRWRPRMAATGYFGGHLGPDSPSVSQEIRCAAACGMRKRLIVESRFRVKPTTRPDRYPYGPASAGRSSTESQHDQPGPLPCTGRLRAVRAGRARTGPIGLFDGKLLRTPPDLRAPGPLYRRGNRRTPDASRV